MGGDGREHVPAPRPAWCGALPRDDSRGGVHRDRARRGAELSRSSAGLVPDPDQVSRRAATEVGRAPGPPVLDEDAYLFDIDAAGLDRPRGSAKRRAIFARCGFAVVAEPLGAMGGPHRRVRVRCWRGSVRWCGGCGYAANTETALAGRPWKTTATAARAEIRHAGIVTIDALAAGQRPGAPGLKTRSIADGAGGRGRQRRPSSPRRSCRRRPARQTCGRHTAKRFWR